MAQVLNQQGMQFRDDLRVLGGDVARGEWVGGQIIELGTAGGADGGVTPPIGHHKRGDGLGWGRVGGDVAAADGNRPVFGAAIENGAGKRRALQVGLGAGLDPRQFAQCRDDIDRLCELIRRVKKRYSVDVYLEPGEAVVLHTGVLVATVLDIVRNKMNIAILDTSAAAHMPDVLEMPYRPEIVGAGKPGEYPYPYRLGGLTCLAGDIIGDYAFQRPLKVGDRLIFKDMAHYTMVKNNTFNGVRLPAIAVQARTGEVRIVRTFHFEDYRHRLS